MRPHVATSLLTRAQENAPRPPLTLALPGTPAPVACSAGPGRWPSSRGGSGGSMLPHGGPRGDLAEHPRPGGGNCNFEASNTVNAPFFTMENLAQTLIPHLLPARKPPHGDACSYPSFLHQSPSQPNVGWGARARGLQGLLAALSPEQGKERERESFAANHKPCMCR